jgi:hypothetical protein
VSLFGQSRFYLPNSNGSDKIRFKLINNLVIIPVEVNGADMNFLLDSGVRKPILFNLINKADSLLLKNVQTVYIRGLGEEAPVEALKSEKNTIKVGDAININQTMYAVFDENLNFSPRLGVTIHGIIGYDLFKDFIVEINYASGFIRLHNPDTYQYQNCRKCIVKDLEIINSKPYIKLTVEIENQQIPVKLLIDSGGTDALWLFENDAKGINISHKSFEDFLGHGLNGSVYGKRSRVDKLMVGKLALNDVNVAFPDSVYFKIDHKDTGRNGSFSGNLLKRFNVIFDYQHHRISLKKNRYFKESFNYNNAGIELEQSGVRLVKEIKNNVNNNRPGSLTSDKEGVNIKISQSYKYVLKPAFSIIEIRKNSPADRIGLKLNDIILSINNKSLADMSLQEVTRFFYEDVGKKIRIKVERNGVPLTFVFKLEDPLK